MRSTSESKGLQPSDEVSLSPKASCRRNLACVCVQTQCLYGDLRRNLLLRRQENERKEVRVERKREREKGGGPGRE